MLVLFINCLILSYGEKIIYHNNYRKFLIHRISSTSIESILFLVSSKNIGYEMPRKMVSRLFSTQRTIVPFNGG